MENNGLSSGGYASYGVGGSYGGSSGSVPVAAAAAGSSAATNAKKTKKKKAVPNSKSLASRVKKKVNIKKTQVLQKMGKEATDYLPEFRADNEHAKELADLYADFTKLASHAVKEAQAYSQTGRSLAEAIAELGSADTSDEFGVPLQRFAQVIKGMQDNRDNFLKATEEYCIMPIDRFNREDIAEARKTKARFREARIQFDAANNQLTPLVAKLDKPFELFLAYTHFHYAQRKYNKRLLEASNKLSDVVESKEFMVLEYLVYMMQTQLQEFAVSYNQLYELDSYIAQLRDSISKQRQAAAVLRKQHEETKLEMAIKAEKSKYRPLVELLAAPDLAVTNAICISAGSEQAATLDTLLMSTFTLLTGMPYLQNCLRPFIDEIMADCSGYEVNPAKAEQEDVSQNMQKLLNMCQRIVDRIFASTDECPRPFRVMANHLQKECVKRFADSRHKSIGGFIFLRFFCPAILSPDSRGLVEPPMAPEARRPLILISKAIQNLANEVPFGAKEEYMSPVNAFIERNQERCRSFFDEIATVPDDVMDYTPLASMEQVNSHEMPSIHQYVVKNLDKIAKTLALYENADSIPLLAHILAQLSDPEEPPVVVNK
ncbi:Ras GTPase activation domain containing protein [Balamuthia mandrillaris]